MSTVEGSNVQTLNQRPSGARENELRAFPSHGPALLRGAQPRVALIHYWLIGMRGGEKVLEALCRLFPEADIYTHVYDPGKVSATIRRHRVFTTNIARLPMARLP